MIGGVHEASRLGVKHSMAHCAAIMCLRWSCAASVDSACVGPCHGEGKHVGKHDASLENGMVGASTRLGSRHRCNTCGWYDNED